MSQSDSPREPVSHPVPGDLLRGNAFLGFSFEQILAAGSVPFILLTIAVVIEPIPTAIGFIAGGLFIVTLIVVGLKAPEGQDPLRWTGDTLRRRFSPNHYYLKPTSADRSPAIYLDVVHTADPELVNTGLGTNTATYHPRLHPNYRDDRE